MRVRGALSLSILLAVLCLSTSACTWFSHLTNFNLQRELAERSKQGLAAVRFEYDAIGIRSFDGRKIEVKVACFVGGPRGGPLGDWAVFVAEFQGKSARKVKDLPASQGGTLDWSPDGRNLLLSSGDIEILNVETGQSRKIADGRDARWSPSGDWISYVNLQQHAALLNLRTHETKIIDPGAEIAWQIEWSPDGKLLLLAETGGTYFGLQWVYRISDSAYFPVHDLGVYPRPNWITQN